MKSLPSSPHYGKARSRRSGWVNGFSNWH